MNVVLREGSSAAPLSVLFLQGLQSSDGFLENLPIGVYTCDVDGCIVQYNRRAAELWGQSPAIGSPDQRFCGALKAFRPTGEPLALFEAPMRELLETSQAICDREIVIERTDGSRITILANLDPLFDGHGKLVGGISCFQDVTRLKRAEAKAQEQDQRLAATYEHAAIAISEVDADGRLLRVNETACNLTGYSREELLARTIFDVTHPDDRGTDAQSYGRQRDGHGDSYVIEKRLVRKDGRVIWASVTSSSVRDAAGRFLYGIRVMQDITGRKLGEEALRESERRYRELIEALPAAIYTTDAKGGITYYNRAAATLWGREPELGNENWCGSWKIYWPDGTRLPHDECPMAMALKEERPVRGFEAVAERPDGTRVPFAPYPTPLRDASGQLVGAVNMLVDISGRKDAEAALREQDQRLAATYEHAHIGIAEADADGRHLRVNETLCAITGYSRQEMLERTFFDNTHPDDIEPDRTLYAEQIAGARERYFVDKRYVRKDGAIVWVSVNSSVVRDAAGRFLYAVRVIQDVTERRRAELHQKALLDELNHRVKNTLATVQSLASQTLRGKLDADLRASFDGRLFALSAIHDQLTRERWEAADFAFMLDDVLAPYRGGSVDQVSLDGGKVRLQPRAALTLTMVMHELATNAAKYGALSAPGGKLAVTWAVNGAGETRRLKVHWQEAGGPPVTPPSRRGFGSRLVERGITQELKGSVELDYAPSGLRCLLEIPLPNFG